MALANDQFGMRQLHLDTLDVAAASPALSTVSLHETVHRLRQMTQGSRDHLVLLDRSLRVLFVNRATAGVAPAQLVGRPIETVLPQRSRERALSCMRRVVQHAAPDRFEVEWTSPEGTARFLEVRVAPVVEEGNVVALTLNGSDTTEHVLAQRAIAMQAKMIESMLEGVALVNTGGMIVITNPAFDNLLGYARGMLIGQSLSALAGGTALDRGLLAAFSGGAGPWPLEFEARRNNGGAVTVAGALSRLDDGGRTHVLLVLQDVSERKLLEGAILQAVNREQHRIGNDLHDGLGQELTGIALMLRCLAGRLSNEHRTAVPDVENITRLVNSAVESTRTLARGLSPVTLERGGLRDALPGLAMHVREMYGIRVTFKNRLPADLPLDDELSNHLYRIAQEAITNAVKHGRAKQVNIQLSAHRENVRLVVTDDGCGLPVDLSNTTGMGLRIMRYRAHIARGEIRFERGASNGTRIECECPLTHRNSHVILNAQTAPKVKARKTPHRATPRPHRIAAKRVRVGAVKRAATTLRRSPKSKRLAKGESK